MLACDGLWDVMSNQDVVNFVLDNCYDIARNKRRNTHVNIAKKLADIKTGSKVTIDASQSHYIDLDVVEIIYDFEIAAKLKNINVTLINMPARMAVSGH